MKNFIYLYIIGILFISCSDDGDDKKNTSLITPVLIMPADNKLCVSNTVSFEWSKNPQAENAIITYQIEIATDNQFTQIIQTAETTSNSQIIELEKNTAYYWRIKAIDSNDLSSEYSATNKFYTAGDAVINHLPFAPELVAPAINAAFNTTSANLTWNATDVDATDVLTYDVYFGTANPPTSKVSENTSSKSYAVTLEAAKEYFWKVVVKDNNGGETIGQVWKFKTN